MDGPTEKRAPESLPAGPKIGSGEIPEASPATATDNAQPPPPETASDDPRPLAPESAVEGVPELSDIVMAVRHHLLLSGVLSLLAAGSLAVVAWTLVRPTYEAVSFVQVRQRQDVVFEGRSSRAEDAAFARAQEQRVVKQPVLASALRRPEIGPLADAIPEHDAVRWLRNRIRVDLQGASEVMTVQVEHPRAAVALALNTAVTNAYLEDFVEQSAGDRERKRTKLRKAAEEADRRLSAYWAKLNRLAEEVGTGSPQQLTVRDEIQLQGYREYAQRLRAAQLRGNQLRGELGEEKLKAEQATELSDSKVEEMIGAHPQVVEKRRRLEQAEAKLREMETLASRDDAPRLQRLRDDRDAYAEDLRQLLETLRPTLRQRLRQQQQRGQISRITRLEEELERNSDEVAFLREMLAKLETEIDRTGDDSGVQLEMIRHEIDRQRRLADNLWQSLEKLEIEAGALPRVALLEAAKLPRLPDRGKQLQATGAAGAAGLVFAILVVGYGEWRSCRVRGSRDVTARTGMRLFGNASGVATDRQRRRRSRQTDQAAGPPGGVSDVVAHLLRVATERSLPTLLVSSATPDEPRNTVALDLARALASTGRRTLLIDADGETRWLEEALACGETGGLLHVSRAGENASQHVLATNEPHLQVLPSGTARSNPGVATARCLERTLAELRCRYEAVVVNGPAILTSPESVLLAAHVDRTLLATVIGRSRWNRLAAARDRMESVALPVLGCVLTAAKPHQHDSQPVRVTGPATASAPLREPGSPEEQLHRGVKELRSHLGRAVTPPPRSERPQNTV